MPSFDPVHEHVVVDSGGRFFFVRRVEEALRLAVHHRCDLCVLELSRGHLRQAPRRAQLPQ